MSILNNGITSFTWDTKPAVTNWPKFSPIFVTDVGRVGSAYAGSLWHHNGVNWYPANGEIVLARGQGSLTTPVTSLSGAAAGKLALPGGDIVIPANMLIPGSSFINIESRFRKVGTNAAPELDYRIGILGTVVDPVAGFHVPTGSGTNVDYRTDLSLWVSSASVYTKDSNASLYPDNVLYNTLLDITAGVNAAAVQYIGFYISAGNVLDTYNLISYRVSVSV